MPEFRPRRSLLFVPGGEPRKLAAAKSAGADTILFDLEDSVAEDDKDAARCLVAAALCETDFGDAERAVRLNPTGTPHFAADLESSLHAGARTFMIPKCNSAQDLREVARRLDAWEKAAGIENESVRLLALIETAAGVAQALDIASSTSRVDALCFGHADFALDMGLPHADSSSPLILHARASIAIAAKARGRVPIDNVFLAVKDETAFAEDVRIGIELGYEGKLCIHPRQVELVNRLYTPTPEQIEYAERVIEGWQRCQAEGRGVFTLDNKMIDAPLVAAQRRVLERSPRTKG